MEKAWTSVFFSAICLLESRLDSLGKNWIKACSIPLKTDRMKYLVCWVGKYKVNVESYTSCAVSEMLWPNLLAKILCSNYYNQSGSYRSAGQYLQQLTLQDGEL